MSVPSAACHVPSTEHLRPGRAHGRWETSTVASVPFISACISVQTRLPIVNVAYILADSSHRPDLLPAALPVARFRASPFPARARTRRAHSAVLSRLLVPFACHSGRVCQRVAMRIERSSAWRTGARAAAVAVGTGSCRGAVSLSLSPPFAGCAREGGVLVAVPARPRVRLRSFILSNSRGYAHQCTLSAQHATRSAQVGSQFQSVRHHMRTRRPNPPPAHAHHTEKAAVSRTCFVPLLRTEVRRRRIATLLGHARTSTLSRITRPQGHQQQARVRLENERLHSTGHTQTAPPAPSFSPPV